MIGMAKLLLIPILAMMVSTACEPDVVWSPEDVQNLEEWGERQREAARELNHYLEQTPRKVKCSGITQEKGFTCKTFNELTTSDPSLVDEYTPYFLNELIIDCAPEENGTWRPTGNLQLGPDAPPPGSEIWVPTNEEIISACDVIAPIEQSAAP